MRKRMIWFNSPKVTLCCIILCAVVSVFALSENATADKHYPDGYVGYLGDGIIKPGEDETEALTRAVQNPVASLISLPFQYNANFKFGPEEKTQHVLNIQPVLPFWLSTNWKVITRAVLPVVSQPGFVPGQDRETGLGDTVVSAFFAPNSPGRWIWGVGPALLLPTSTDSRLGPGEWGAGPTAVALTMRGRWVAGSLISNVWSFTGDSSVNLFTWQPFVNYNFEGGWYATTSPVITANWEADSGNRWTIPLGGGFGRVFRIGSQNMNSSLQAFYNIEKPDNIGPEWSLRFSIQFLFPKK